ncbi:MAG TPA: ubiquinol-cytochrome C chaperone family protein [Caulobacteraceae bacterium]|jgi:cytochrome b pre-mRNA-processing protein 3
MLKLLRRPSSSRAAAERLHAAAVAQSRSPALYARMGAPDTIEGRFELLCAHIVLLLDRLKGEPGALAETRQALFDVFVSHLDGAMREMGVGDLAMGKRMRRLAEAFYGRLQAYEAVFAVLPERASLEAVVARTVLDGVEADSGDLAEYLSTARLALAAQEPLALLRDGPSWPAP